MLFYADRSIKDNLFNMYKRDAMDYAAKKYECKNQRINEERSYLENLNKKEQMEEDRRRLEKIKRTSEAMNEYNQLVNMKRDGILRRSKVDDVKINSYGIGSNQMANSANNSIVFSQGNDVSFYQRECDLNKKVSLSPQANNVKKLVNLEDRNLYWQNDNLLMKMQKLQGIKWSPSQL